MIDPEKIEEYISRDGYAGMAKALTEMKPGANRSGSPGFRVTRDAAEQDFPPV